MNLNNNIINNIKLTNNNPQIAYNINKKKYYYALIQKNKIILNSKFKKYTPIYFRTGYDSIYYPNKITIPN